MTTPTRSASTGEQAATNIGDDVRSAKGAIERGDWVDAGLSITNVAMDVINIAGDPLGAASSAGFGWIIEHISFLREPFDALLGDANSIIGSAQGWTKTGEQLTATAQKYREAAKSETANWTGSAGQAYRNAAATQADGLDSLAEISKGVGQAISGAGQLLAEVRKTVLDFIDRCVQRVIQIIIEALSKAWLSFGASIAEGIVKSVAQAVQTAQKIVGKIQKFISSLQKIMTTVQKIVNLAKAVKQLLETIGGKANTTPSAVTTQAAPVNTTEIDAAANRNYTNPNAVANSADYRRNAAGDYDYNPYQPGVQAPAPTYGQSAPPVNRGYTPLPDGGQRTAAPYSGGPGVVAPIPNISPPPSPGAPASRVDRARWIGDAVEILIKHGVEPGRIDADQIARIVDRNSEGNPHAVSPDGSLKGLTQISDPVFRQHQLPGRGDIWAPVDNVLAGVMYFLTQWGTLLAAFNATAPSFTMRTD
ncbi:MAG: hypothetical protein M3548_16745 [Actinomycetota bacterium]|nr:hypothetical protein [Actinomycetota bacterium]